MKKIPGWKKLSLLGKNAYQLKYTNIQETTDLQGLAELNSRTPKEEWYITKGRPQNQFESKTAWKCNVPRSMYHTDIVSPTVLEQVLQNLLNQ